MTSFWKLSAAGFAATAITYGPARMGFGLFLPDLTATFALATATAGVIASVGFAGFLLGLLTVYPLTARYGPRLPVLVGLSAATLGMAVIAVAPNVPILALGLFLAMSSAGFSWAPFNNAVNRRIGDARKSTALSIVSTGTGLGVALAAAAALALDAFGLSWRIGWAAFAVASALVMLLNWLDLREVAGSGGHRSQQSWRALLEPAAMPLYGIALSYGTTSAIYIAFAAERVQAAGGVPGLPPGAAPGVLFASYGIIGLAGLATGRIETVTGLEWLLRLLLLSSALSLVLVAHVPGSWPGVVLSAGLQGLCVMMMSAVLSFWSERLFPDLPSMSFTAALVALATGSVVGPAVAGAVSSALGAGPMFLGAAAISLATAAAVRARHARVRPVQG